MLLPDWRKQLQESFRKNVSEPAIEYIQLATIKPYGKPTNKIVRFQSFFNKHPTVEDCKLISMLMMFIDARTNGINDVLDGSPYGEVCIFLPLTNEIYRLSGKLYLILSPNNSSYSQANCRNDMFSLLGYDMEKERLRIWNEYIAPVRSVIQEKFNNKRDKYNSREIKKFKLKPISQNDNDLIKNDEEATPYNKTKTEKEEEEENLSINPRDTSNTKNKKSSFDSNFEKGWDRNIHNDEIESDSDEFIQSYPINDNASLCSTSSESFKINNFPNDFQENSGFDLYSSHLQKQMNMSLSDKQQKSYHESDNAPNYLDDNTKKSSYDESKNYNSEDGQSCTNLSKTKQHQCKLCQKMMMVNQHECELCTMSGDDLEKEMIDNFGLLLLDVNKVDYSNYGYIPIKKTLYTRTYAIQDDIVTNSPINGNNGSHCCSIPLYSKNNETKEESFKTILSNTYQNLDFDNIGNVKSIHSCNITNPESSSTTNKTIPSITINDSKPILETEKSIQNEEKDKDLEIEKWESSLINYTYINY